jgi:hypothetical protein
MPHPITINGRTLDEILSMVGQDALIYLEAAKDDHAIMAAAYDYEVANKCRYPVFHPIKIWRDSAAH